MTKAQAIQKVRELAQTARREIIAEAEKLLEFSCVEKETYDNNYELPKILITAALRRKKDMFHPFMDDKRAIVSKLERG